MGEIGDRLPPGGLREAHGDSVERVRNGGGQRYRAGVAAAVILRTPIADADRCVLHDRVGREAVHQGGRVDERLERRARLSKRVGSAVALALAVIAATD